MIEMPMFEKRKEFRRSDCGCDVVVGDTVAQIVYCPQHAAAPEMFELLEAAPLPPGTFTRREAIDEWIDEYTEWAISVNIKLAFLKLATGDNDA